MSIEKREAEVKSRLSSRMIKDMETVVSKIHEREDVKKMVQETIMESYLGQMVQVWVQNFTLDEIEEVLDITEKPVLKKLNEVVMPAMYPVIQEYMQEIMLKSLGL